MVWLIWLSAICAIVNAVRAPCTAKADEDNQFYLPSPDCNQFNLTGIQVYSWGSSIEVTWITSYASVDLTVFQLFAYPINFQKIMLNINKSTTSASWNAFPPLSNSAGPSFFFAMFESGGVNPVFESDVFNVTNIPSSATTTSSSTTSTTSGTSTSSTGTTQSGTAATSAISVATSAATTSASISGTSKSSSSGKYIGIGVGVGVGCVIIIGGLIGWFLFQRRRKKTANPTPTPYHSPAQPSGHNDKMEASSAWQDKYTQQQQQHQPLMYNELDAQGSPKHGYVARPHELEAR